MSNVLIYVEHQGDAPKKSALAAITFGQELVKKAGGELHLVLIGKVGKAAEAVRGFGAQKVHTIDGPAFESYQAETYATALVAAARASGATTVAAAASSTSRDVLPRVAVRLEAGMASDVLAIVDGSTFKRPMWAGNVIATVKLNTPTKVVTVRATEFSVPAAGSSAALAKLDVAIDAQALKAKFVALKAIKSERPDLAAANRVVSGGRGLKAAENFKLIEQLADALHAAVGASRAVCDAGWAPNDLQVGQTGKVVAPDLYVAIGISGAIQHIAGMKGSKVIVAINKDPEAPIFQVADYGLVADLFKAVPELIEKLT